MTDFVIDSAKLKTIRKARKIGRPKLSKMAGLTERQISKLEQTALPSLPEAVALRLAAALQIPVQTLTGELQVIDDDLQPAAGSSGCSCCG